jgi:hypothetical protein
MCFYYMIDMEWTSTYYVGYQCIYNKNRLCEDIMQRRCSYLSYKLCKTNGTKFAWTTSQWKNIWKMIVFQGPWSSRCTLIIASPNKVLINPLYSLRPKAGRLLFGQLVWKKITFFQFFSFRQVNYIFHKLSVNSNHVQFQLCMSPWQIFVKKGY